MHTMVGFLTKVLIFLLSNVVFSQMIPSHRVTDWTVAGAYDYSEPFLFINVVNEGLDNTGANSNDTLLTSIINSIPTTGAIIYFPDGEYLFNQRIVLNSNCIIRGESSTNTIFNFNLGGINNCIQISGNQTSTESLVTNNLSKNQITINVVNGALFSVGDLVILSDDDSSKITSAWAFNSTGQIVEIVSVSANNITIKNPLRRDYLLSNTPKIVKVNPKKNILIENVTINRLDVTTNQTSNILISFASNIKVACIKSFNSNYAHININKSSNVVVEGSYFQDGFSYGGDGKAYGVVLQGTTGESLIYNNIFKHLRHSILLQSGANGNVISYNYSREPYWAEPFLPTNSAGDLVLHGNYPYLNLFEGNIVQNIVIDDSHGINGPFNTFHRNRAELYGIFMNNSPASNQQNFSSNEITNTGFLLGNYTISGTGHFQYNNNKNGSILPSGTNLTTPNSYYLESNLVYYNSNSFWPPIGNSTNYNSYINEGKNRYNNSQLIRCSTNETLNAEGYYNFSFEVFPNPAQKILNIKSNTFINEFVIYNLDGKLLLKEENLRKTQLQIDISDFNKGIYLIILNKKRIVKFVKN